MASSYFKAGTAQLGYTGYGLLQQDVAGSPVIINPPADRISLTETPNNAYGALIDNASILHNKNPGMTTGYLTMEGPVGLDRNMDALINVGFGPRTDGIIKPFIATLLRASGGLTITVAGVYLNALRITGAFDINGGMSRLRYQLAAQVLDPNNVAKATAIIAPSTSNGCGLSVMGMVNVTNGYSGGLVTYDNIRSFAIDFQNGMLVQPWVQDPINRIAGGCTPAPQTGTLQLNQLAVPDNALPQTAAGDNDASPITLYIYSAIATFAAGAMTAGKQLAIDMSASWDSGINQILATEFNASPNMYRLYSTQTQNLATTAPYVATLTSL